MITVLVLRMSPEFIHIAFYVDIQESCQFSSDLLLQ